MPSVGWNPLSTYMDKQHKLQRRERERERERGRERGRERERERERETNKPLVSFSPRPLVVRWVESVNLYGQTTQVTKERERERERERKREREREKEERN